MNKNLLAKVGAVAGTLAASLSAFAMNAHAQILSATDGNTIVDTTQDAANSFLTTTLPLG